jgi:hypothetical protein
LEEQQKRQNKSSGKRRRGRRGNRSRKPQRPRLDLVCSICGKPIKYVYTAIEYGEKREPIHFDCILKKLGEEEELGPNEKICYLGQGTFGIIRYHNGSGGKRFSIRKKIAVEEQNGIAEWRKELGKAVRR